MMVSMLYAFTRSCLKCLFQVGMKQGRQCDFEEENLCGAVNQKGSDNFDWQWVSGPEGGKLLICCLHRLTYSQRH